jgi:ABC-2 type transport system ATP-binding protein
VIELTGVSKHYRIGLAPGRGPGTVEALRDVTLSLGPGVWGVAGPNGAGKTTLFGVMLGFVFASGGQVTIKRMPPRDYCRRHGVGYLPERFQLPPEWTVRGTLRSLARLEGSRGRSADRNVDSVLERLGLDDHATKTLGALSRGLLQRVGIAQALLGDHELIVLDEPTEGLDPLWRIRFRAIVTELRDQNRTVLLASHELAEVERLASRVVLLDGGRIVDLLELEGESARAARGSEPMRYRLQLGEPSAVVAEIFPGATTSDSAPALYLVEVADTAELSARLAALLATGATLEALEPVAEPLEERVRRVLRKGSEVAS